MLSKDGRLIHTRDAEASDREFLRGLHHAAYRDVVTRQFGAWVESDQDAWFYKGFDEGALTVIEVQGVQVGAIGVHVATDHVFLREIQVLPEFQNQGIGTAVLFAQLARAAALGLPLRLRVLQQNRARQLYERHGFSVTGMTETHYEMQWSSPVP